MATYDWSKTAADNGSADSAINFQEGQNPSTVNDSARNLMAEFAKWREDAYGSLSSTGSSNAYAVTINSTITAYTQDLVVTFIANHASTGAATLNVTPSGGSALGTKDLKTIRGDDLGENSIVVNQLVVAVYDGTQFLALGIGIDPAAVDAYNTANKSTVLTALGVPDPTSGDAGKMLDVKSTEDGYELTTVADKRIEFATTSTAQGPSPRFTINSVPTSVPVSNVAGNWYIAGTGSTIGDWSSFSVNDVIYDDGTDYTNYTPLEGWVAYNLDTSRQLVFRSSSWFPNRYRSDGQTITSGGTLQLEHGLGETPDIVQVRLKNVVSDLAYSVDDEVLVNPSGYETAGSSRGGSITADDTNIYVTFSNATAAYAINVKNTGAVTGISNSSWEAIFIAKR